MNTIYWIFLNNLQSIFHLGISKINVCTFCIIVMQTHVRYTLQLISDHTFFHQKSIDVFQNLCRCLCTWHTACSVWARLRIHAQQYRHGGKRPGGVSGHHCQAGESICFCPPFFSINLVVSRLILYDILDLRTPSAGMTETQSI